MSKCIICASILRADIDKMISRGANDRHIKGWARERKLNLSLKAIQTHKIEHLQYIETTSEALSATEPVYLTVGQIEDELQVEYEQLLNYCAANQIEVNREGTYDAIEIMKHQLVQLSEEVKNLNQRLEEIAPQTQKKAIANLKQEKLTAQTRLLTAVANLKEVKLKQAVGELVANLELEEQWSYSLVGFKAKLEAIPNKVALELSPITNKSNVQNILTKLISEALEELDNGSRQAV